jgi:hypothetical protein
LGGAGEGGEERRAAREALEERFATGESGAAEAAKFGWQAVQRRCFAVVSRPCGAPPWPAMPALAGLDSESARSGPERPF